MITYTLVVAADQPPITSYNIPLSATVKSLEKLFGVKPAYVYFLFFYEYEKKH